MSLIIFQKISSFDTDFENQKKNKKTICIFSLNPELCIRSCSDNCPLCNISTDISKAGNHGL